MILCCFFFLMFRRPPRSTLSLHDALPISRRARGGRRGGGAGRVGHLGGGWDLGRPGHGRSEEHTSELQSRPHLVCRLLLEKKNTKTSNPYRRLLCSFFPSKLTHSHYPRLN